MNSYDKIHSYNVSEKHFITDIKRREVSNFLVLFFLDNVERRQRTKVFYDGSTLCKYQRSCGYPFIVFEKVLH